MDLEEVEIMFRKKFSFSALNNVEFRCSSPFKNPSWAMPRLVELKTQLNATKGMLRSNNSESWHDHTAHTNRAGFVFQEVKNFADPELFTQAWLKFYECASQFPGMFESSNQSEAFYSIHLCEAPGAFITSLNHYLQSQNFKRKLKWLGITLNPYYEGNNLKAMISDDYFIYLTQNQWLFGPNDTGDLLDLKNAKWFVEALRTEPINLITADGSIDCSDNPEDQENTVILLKWCETIVGLSVLGCGGSFVLKIFTIFEATTVSLLYLLRVCFSELHVFKPCTSKEGNSEVYVIAIGFKRATFIEDFLGKLWDPIYQDASCACSKPLFSEDEIPQMFKEEIIACATTFKKFQEDVILRNISSYNTATDRKLTVLKKKIARLYVKRYQLQRIPTESFVCGEAKRQLELTRRKFSFQKRNRTTDTIKAVLRSDHRSLLMQFDFIKNYAAEFANIWETELVSDWKLSLKVVNGKSYGVICNSSFSEKLTFQVFYETLKHYEKDCGRKRDMLKSFLHEESQDALLNRFLSAAPLLTEGGVVDVKNVPLLSRFSASTLWLVSKCFKKIELILAEQPCVRLSGYQRNDELLEFLGTVDLSLLSFVKTSHLKSSPFFDIIFSYNSLLLMNYLGRMLGIESDAYTTQTMLPTL